ncbi:hypothetical protein Zmor_020705 [Zophobas morio]|uniref:Uncharacterized protein n=1 Tax=Zophobas morio TaxID=2755281 RepID=A0AA38M9Y6_9CUCU|nr:hypothetical protein Zmor_020705 [Zophobas morio]
MTYVGNIFQNNKCRAPYFILYKNIQFKSRIWVLEGVAISSGMVVAPGTRSVVGDDCGSGCDTGDRDSATRMKASVMRHRGPRQCDPDEDVGDAAQGT